MRVRSRLTTMSMNDVAGRRRRHGVGAKGAEGS
jgi:hypothetical protein